MQIVRGLQVRILIPLPLTFGIVTLGIRHVNSFAKITDFLLNNPAEGATDAIVFGHATDEVINDWYQSESVRGHLEMNTQQLLKVRHFIMI